MSCDEVRQFLLDDEDGRSRAVVESHLKQCSACQVASAGYARIRNVLQPTSRDRAAEPDAGWETFEQRLLAQKLLAAPRTNVRRGEGARIGARARFGWAVAASVVLGAAGFQAGRWYPNHPAPLASDIKRTDGPETTKPPPTHARLAEADVTRQVRAFEEVSQVFDGRASWVMVSDHAADMGLAPQPLERPQPALLLLRLTMLRGNQIVSQTDLAIVSGQSADLSVPIPAGRTLRYQIDTTRDQPTRLNLWAEVQTPAGGQALAALATTLQPKPGRNITAGRLTTAGGVYELQVEFAQGAAINAPAGGASRPAPPVPELIGS